MSSGPSGRLSAGLPQRTCCVCVTRAHKRRKQMNANVESTRSPAMSARGEGALKRRAQQIQRYQEWLASEEASGGDGADERAETAVQFDARTLFFASISQNDFREVERLLSSGLVSVDAVNADGLTALHEACIDDNSQMALFLLERGADVNVRDHEGWTALHATASCGHRTLVRLLLDFGANALAVNADGELAIDVAGEADGAEEVIDTLREAMRVTNDENAEQQLHALRRQELTAIERDVNDWIERRAPRLDETRDANSGATVLHVCAAKGYHEPLARLLEHFPALDLNARDHDGWTALHAAAYFQQATAFESLVTAGADWEARTGAGLTCAELSADNKRIAELLALCKRQRVDRLRAEAERIAPVVDERPIATPPTAPPPPPPPSTPPPPPPPAPSLPPEPPVVVVVSAAPEEEAPESGGEENESRESKSMSETQRKAKSKKVRETRRSTQGVNADDVNEAFKLLNQISGNNNNNNNNAVNNQSIDVSVDIIDNRIIRVENNNDEKTSSTTPTTNSNANHDSHDNNQNDNDDNNVVTIRRNRRSKPRRHPTGIGDTTTNDTADDDVDNNNGSVSIEVTTTAPPSLVVDESMRSRSVSSTSSRASLTDSTADTTGDTSSLASSGGSTRDFTARTAVAGDQQSIDWRALYEALAIKMSEKEEHERRRELEWSRERRALQRRVSELEEELKSLELLRTENIRLRDENSALIRVISKLSK